jgi:hypothetical protein
MPTLKEPQKSIPGGFVFYVPETGWSPAPFSSLDSIMQQLIAHRKGQPYLCAKNGWPLDPAAVYQEVLAFNVAKCVQMGWNDYLIGGAETVPFPPPTPPRQRLRNLAAGANTIVSWVEDGAPTVSQELANRRASVCHGGDDPDKRCPLNGAGGFESYFTVPVANAIRAQIERKRSLKLETPGDDRLGVCTGCDCPLTLKIWMPMENILKKMSADTVTRLDPRCWILKRDA